MKGEGFSYLKRAVDAVFDNDQWVIHRTLLENGWGQEAVGKASRFVVGENDVGRASGKVVEGLKVVRDRVDGVIKRHWRDSGQVTAEL